MQEALAYHLSPHPPDGPPPSVMDGRTAMGSDDKKDNEMNEDEEELIAKMEAAEDDQEAHLPADPDLETLQQDLPLS